MDKKVPTSRSANFSPEEIEIILDELSELPELVSGTFSARFPTNKHLSEQWRILAEKLTSSNMGVERTETQVRNKWQDMKYRVKQKRIKHNQHMSGTGGGPGDKTPYTKTDLRIIGLIGVRCVEGVTDDSCDTTTRTLQNLKKKNMACDLPTTDADRSEINAENSEHITVTFVSEAQNSTTDEVLLVATPVADQENEEIMTTPLQTPKTSWPIRKSSNSSTQRGQKHRERKRKRNESELEDFENAALEMQRNLCQQVTSLAASVAQVVPAVSAQQDMLNNINNNLITLLDKIDKTNTLLQVALNVDEEFAKDT